MNDILLNIVNIRMAIMICIGVILVREIYKVLKGYISKAVYAVAALIVIVIAAIDYGVIYIADAEILIHRTGMYEFTVIIIYLILIAFMNTFKTIRNGSFTKSDRINIAAYVVVLCVNMYLLIRLGLSNGRHDIMLIMNIIVLCLILAYIFYRTLVRLYQENYKGQEAEHLREVIESGEDYLKNVQAMDKQVRTVRHDMNNQLQIIYGLLSQERYDEAKAFLKEYSISLEKTKEYIHTDDPIFNTVINNKIEYAKSEDIIITTGLHKTLKPMHGNDLYTIMGNVLDNAIEAELKEEPCNREIEIRSVWNGDDMVITVENYISQSVLNGNKELHTSKQDKKSHGLGTQIIKKLVKKNNGTCDYHEEGNMFCCEIRW